MKAVQFESFGDPRAVVHVVDLPDPDPPGTGEVLLAVEATPINPSDLLTLSGTYGQLPKLPAIAGNEGVGRVLAIGPDVTDIAVGDRVLLPLGSGTWRDKMKTRASLVIPIPANADPLQLAMTVVNPPTAYLMLKEIIEVKAGEWVIQNAANSAVGQYLIYFAKAQGLKTVNVVRRPELREGLLALGADVVVVDGPDLRKEVAEATGGARIALGIDAVAGEATGRLSDCVAEGGTVVNYGAMSGQPCQISPAQLIARDIRLRGFWLSSWARKAPKGAFRDVLQKMTELLAANTLKATVEATYPFERIKEAIAHAQKEGRSGKILLVGASS
jgi:NADPH:quinone reductase-like Zn-dependent oxidoreductase